MPDPQEFMAALEQQQRATDAATQEAEVLVEFLRSRTVALNAEVRIRDAEIGRLRERVAQLEEAERDRIVRKASTDVDAESPDDAPRGD